MSALALANQMNQQETSQILKELASQLRRVVKSPYATGPDWCVTGLLHGYTLWADTEETSEIYGSLALQRAFLGAVRSWARKQDVKGVTVASLRVALPLLATGVASNRD